MSRAPGGAVLAAAGIAAEYGGELYPRTCPARSSTPLLAGEAGISATLESGRTMSWATPVRSHVVVTMMARSITVERSVPALLGLARVSGLGAARFFIYQGLKVGLQEFLKGDLHHQVATIASALVREELFVHESQLNLCSVSEY